MIEVDRHPYPPSCDLHARAYPECIEMTWLGYHYSRSTLGRFYKKNEVQIRINTLELVRLHSLVNFGENLIFSEIWGPNPEKVDPSISYHKYWLVCRINDSRAKKVGKVAIDLYEGGVFAGPNCKSGSHSNISMFCTPGTSKCFVSRDRPPICFVPRSQAPKMFRTQHFILKLFIWKIP